MKVADFLSISMVSKNFCKCSRIVWGYSRCSLTDRVMTGEYSRNFARSLTKQRLADIFELYLFSDQAKIGEYSRILLVHWPSKDRKIFPNLCLFTDRTKIAQKIFPNLCLFTDRTKIGRYSRIFACSLTEQRSERAEDRYSLTESLPVHWPNKDRKIFPNLCLFTDRTKIERYSRIFACSLTEQRSEDIPESLLVLYKEPKHTTNSYHVTCTTYSF